MDRVVVLHCRHLEMGVNEDGHVKGIKEEPEEKQPVSQSQCYFTSNAQLLLLIQTAKPHQNLP